MKYYAEEHNKLGGHDSCRPTIKAELTAVQKGIAKTAELLITGLDAAFEMKPPYPFEYRELIHRATRYTLETAMKTAH